MALGRPFRFPGFDYDSAEAKKGRGFASRFPPPLPPLPPHVSQPSPSPPVTLKRTPEKWGHPHRDLRPRLGVPRRGAGGGAALRLRAGASPRGLRSRGRKPSPEFRGARAKSRFLGGGGGVGPVLVVSKKFGRCSLLDVVSEALKPRDFELITTRLSWVGKEPKAANQPEVHYPSLQ